MILPPSPSEHMSERLAACFTPLLDKIGMAESTTAPILHVFLRNMHHMLLDQYTYEQVYVVSCV